VKLEYKTDFKINGLTSPVYLQKAAAYWGRSLGSGGATLAYDNIQESNTPDYFRECYTALGVKSMIGFPIKKGKTQWGSLVLSEYKNYRHWSDEEKILLETISDQMYIAINQSELYEAVQKTAENERVLRKIMLSSVKTFDFQERVKAIVDEVGGFYKADRCFFVGYDSDIASDREIRTYAEYLSSEEIQSQLTNRPDKATIERLVQLLKLRNVLAVENIEEAVMLDSAKQMLEKLSVKSYLVAPVFYGDINYGAVVWHYVHDYKKFSQEDIAMAQAIANQSAVVINQTQLYSTIEKNEKYTRTIMDSIKDGIITINDDFDIESCNPSVEAIWGYSLDEVVGQKLDLLLHHDCLNTDKKICLSGKTSFGVRKNGAEFPIEVDVSEINFEDKKSTLLVIRDITERKKMEKMKNEFISTVSHELRTPLTSIKGALGLITSGVLGALPPKINDLANIANNNCSRLTNLINDILDLEKIKAGKYEFKYEELEINSIIEQSVVLNQSYADQFGMKLSVDMHFEEAYIKADKNRLLQVLSNLISNAVKFSKLGGEVKIISEIQGEQIKVSVVDNGIGIPDDSKYKIFQSFSQVDSSDTRSKGGTGLGLSISKLIVEKMGGEIDFESVAQEGSIFFFTLPTVIKGEFKSDQGELSELSAESDAW